MKKFLPKTLNNPYGFTLVELLVVISIIAILTVIGIALYGGVQGKARDIKRKADVDAIIKAYEIKYDAEAGKYPLSTAVTAADFAGGVRPFPPENTKLVPAAYNEILPTTQASVTVCAALEGGPSGNPTSCTASTTTGCYCKSGAQAAAATVIPAGVSTCPAFNSSTTQTCTFLTTFGGCGSNITFPIYIKCSELTSALAGVPTANCSGTNVLSNAMNYYSSDTAGVGPAGQFRLAGTSACIFSPSSQGLVNIRATN